MIINIERLRKEMEFITTHRDKHDQSVWAAKTSCGTVGCLAGNIVFNEGLEIDWLGKNASYCFDEQGDNVSIRDQAALILGLSWDQAEILFDGNNNLPGMWRYISNITNGEIEVPIEFQQS